MIRKALLLILPIFMMPGPVIASPSSASTADYILVKKSERKLFLLNNGNILKEYNVSLGQNPKGNKERRGDKKTPEGVYKITYRNPQSKFHYSLHINYPNSSDRRRANQRGLNPGSEIFLHGIPNRHRDPEALRNKDWTNGCIALMDHEIKEIARYVKDGTVIEILP